MLSFWVKFTYFHIMEELFITNSWKNNLVSMTKLVPVTCIFMSANQQKLAGKCQLVFIVTEPVHFHEISGTCTGFRGNNG